MDDLLELQAGIITNCIAYILLIILVYFSARTFPTRIKSNRLLYALFGMSFLEVTLHMFTTFVQYYLFYGNNLLGTVLYSLVFSVDAAYMLVWVMFLQERLKKFGSPRVNYKKWLLLVRIPSIVLLVLSFINIFYPVYFSYENFEYVRKPFYGLTLYVPVSYFIYGMILYIHTQYKRSIYQIVPFIQLIAPILLAHIIENYFMEICVIPLSKVIALLILVLANSKMDASVDALTGLFTRGELYRYLTDVIARGTYKQIYGIMIDLNHFKAINDTYGHLVGDNALSDFGSVVKSELPAHTLAFRYAGDEFVVLLFQADDVFAQKVIADLKYSLVHFNEKNHNPYVLDASFGYTALQENDTVAGFIERMDGKMYEDKKRNR